MQEKRYIIDTTLRDGAQSPNVILTNEEKLLLAKWFDEVGVYQIEAGIPAMGSEEKEMVMAIKDSCQHAKISAWNRLSLEDIAHSIDCQPDVIHISVPVSALQIHEKLGWDEAGLLRRMLDCVSFARDKGYEVTVGFEDASRADAGFMTVLAKRLVKLDVESIRFADTVGILTPSTAYEKVKYLRDTSGIGIEFHAHNDFGMAVANSVAALQAGAFYADTTLNGIGERTGNCDMAQLLKAAGLLYDMNVARLEEWGLPPVTFSFEDP